MSVPPFTASGDLPPGIHRATLAEVLERFGSGSPQPRCWSACDSNAFITWRGQLAILLAVWSSGRL